LSFSRLALRLAAYEALAPYSSRVPPVTTPPTSPAWPTIAGANVYDTRMDPLAGADSFADFVLQIEGNPVVILYTDDQETEPTAGEYPADLELADLCATLFIASAGTVTVTETGGQTASVGPAITDPQQEALLDLLEAQIRQILDPQAINQVAPSGPLFKVARELRHVHSVPERSADKTVRVAQRHVRFRFRISQTIWNAPGTVPEGINILPQPLLTVALGLNVNSPSYQMLAQFAAYLANPPALTPLLDIRMNVNVNRNVAPTDPAGSDADVIGDVTFVQGVGNLPVGGFGIGTILGFAHPIRLLNFLWLKVAPWLRAWIRTP
jgi:hypothetical protein